MHSSRIRPPRSSALGYTRKVHRQPNRRFVVGFAALGACVVCLTTRLLIPRAGSRLSGPSSITEVRFRALVSAYDAYYREYGDFPPSKNALQGDNSKQMEFVERADESIWLDGWGNPIQIVADPGRGTIELRAWDADKRVTKVITGHVHSVSGAYRVRP